MRKPGTLFINLIIFLASLTTVLNVATRQWARALDSLAFAYAWFLIRRLTLERASLQLSLHAFRKWAWHANLHLPPDLRAPESVTLEPEPGDPLL